MYKHHEDTIKNIIDKLKQKEEVLSVIVGGSIAHENRFFSSIKNFTQ